MIKHREAIGNVCRLLAAKAEFRRKIDTAGPRMSYLGGHFVGVAALYEKLCNDKIVTREQGWRTFAAHFQTAYGQAADLWKDVDETSGPALRRGLSFTTRSGPR